MYCLSVSSVIFAVFVLEFSSQHRASGAKLRRKRDEDPCSTMKCEHFCVTRGGQAGRCVCHRGYKLQPNGYSCREINECQEDKKLCGNGTCHNIAGSYFCSCKYGFYYDRQEGTCKDVNECTVSAKICGPGKCINKPGLYECKCDAGHHFNQRTWYCEAAIYECEDKIHACRVNSLCSDLYGEFKCKEVKCPNSYYSRKNTNLCVLQCPANDTKCAEIKAKTIKWTSRSFKKSIPANETQFVYWYGLVNKKGGTAKKQITFIGKDENDFEIEHLHNKFVRVYNSQEIKGPKSYTVQLNVDYLDQGEEIRKSFNLHISVSK